MDDKSILKHIEELVNEEHELLDRRNKGTLGEDQHERIHQLEVSLDQCWDLLRQRRARRHAGENPDEAQLRDPNIVEHYKQ
ncbi:DUF2630 family protein [Ktedonospora formicarum]|uniref:DUF2630 domain-containing protein n=1 Tax=Ktedonospora formicarum TaxID=2778364 RepID=A0A8J3I188_9CHLR|nr:DUF2630 family protein [Ktedonospora formicarum]GHO43669.1 hypothetical protein KSX_18320 [Ktedonospora formicarum]